MVNIIVEGPRGSGTSTIAGAIAEGLRDEYQIVLAPDAAQPAILSDVRTIRVTTRSHDGGRVSVDGQPCQPIGAADFRGPTVSLGTVWFGLVFDPRDLWVGAYVDTRRRRLYVLPLPTVGLVFGWER